MNLRDEAAVKHLGFIKQSSAFGERQFYITTNYSSNVL